LLQQPTLSLLIEESGPNYQVEAWLWIIPFFLLWRPVERISTTFSCFFFFFFFSRVPIDHSLHFLISLVMPPYSSLVEECNLSFSVV
jgi:hypothetical protein